MDPSHFLGIDWGSTNARAMLFDRSGTLLEQREHPLGIKQIDPGTHRAAFHRMTGEWRERFGPIPALLSGMIGSRHGWQEAPYLPCPVNLAELTGALTRVPDETNVFIVPGLKMNQGRPDVLRGEELQILGVGPAAADFDCICIPGTHAKWIVTDGDVVREFHTAMTGEVYAAIMDHTLFAQLISAPATSAPLRAAAFEAGLERSAAPHGLLQQLFGLRAGFLLGEIGPKDLSDLVAGILIGTEIRHMQSLGMVRRHVAVMGSASLSPRYLHALERFSCAARSFDVRATTARGFVRLYQSFRGIREM